MSNGNDDTNGDDGAELSATAGSRSDVERGHWLTANSVTVTRSPTGMMQVCFTDPTAKHPVTVSAWTLRKAIDMAIYHYFENDKVMREGASEG